MTVKNEDVGETAHIWSTLFMLQIITFAILSYLLTLYKCVVSEVLMYQFHCLGDEIFSTCVSMNCNIIKK
jgi:hypothetical protein